VREALQGLTGHWHLVAIGKAAHAMVQGAYDALGERIDAGLVIGPHGFPRAAISALPIPLCVLEAGHPVPDVASLEAGAALDRFIDSAPSGAPFLLLISGGASALVERLPQGATLAGLAGLNRWLLASGLDIAAVNRVRQAVSCIKGGRLAARLAGRDCRALLISDVAGDDPALIGSGLLAQEREDAGLPELPPAIRAGIRFAPRPGPAAARPAAIRFEIVARLELAMDAARRAAAEVSPHVVACPERLAGDAAEAGREIARTLRSGAAGVYLWGGETTVHLPAAPGRGGRCQHLALALALALEGEHRWVLLAAGSDGFDGPGEDAGAIVDGGTLARGRLGGLDPLICLARADAGTFLEAAGDLLNTGPTGTNVADLIIACRAG
jgi:hydroxypyruvate reductase